MQYRQKGRHSQYYCEVLYMDEKVVFARYVESDTRRYVMMKSYFHCTPSTFYMNWEPA